MKYKKAYKSEKGKDEVINIYDEILKKWKVTYEVFNIDSSYGSTFVIRSGDIAFPPLLLLHGTSSNSAIWIEDVEEYSKNFCVYAIDIPGEPGKSEERQYSLKEPLYIKWLNEIVTTLKLRKVSIVGISLGAWLAVGYASQYPQNIDKLVLLCPSGIGSQKVSFILKAMPLMLLGDWGFNRISRMVNGNQTMLKEAEEYTKLIARNFNLRTEPVPIYSDDELRQLKMPVLVFAGENDVLLNSYETVSCISRVLPEAKVSLLSGYGHVLIGLKSQIADFLLTD
ncbi:MAG TPA: alpha/beta hydrolase [Clostridia bacterium]